jgi:hypothetical protein
MNCFFLGGAENGNKLAKEGLVSFAIPDLGVLFKTRHFGSPFECEYMSLLVLLAFIEKNPRAFSQQKIHIYSENPLIVYQINQKAFCSRDLKPHRDKALSYKKKFSYSISWVPSYENRAREILFGRPSTHQSLKLDSDIFESQLQRGHGQLSKN